MKDQPPRRSFVVVASSLYPGERLFFLSLFLIALASLHLLACSPAAGPEDNESANPGTGTGGVLGGLLGTGTGGTGANTGGTGPGQEIPDGVKPFEPAACLSRPGNSTPPRQGGSRCTVPTHVGTFYGGNGHSETWDGRVFIVTRGPDPVGWRVRVFRPECLVKSKAGVVDFSQNQPFSEEVILETDSEATGSHNAHAIIPHPDYPENPFRSNADGTANPSGTHLTYELLLYAQNYEDNSSLQVRHARVVVDSPYTTDASIASAQMVDGFQTLETKSGDKLRAIEPTLTLDGHLVIAQGHPDNDGKIDNLIYSYNPVAGALEGWSEPRYITALHTEKDIPLGGLTLGERVPLAQQPLVDQMGEVFAADAEFRGAYPWISQDGAELFYMALRTFDGARRGGASVIGRWTNWSTRHIDGPINPNRIGTPETLRLFFSSPGAFTTMWTPYSQMDAPPFPYRARGPSYPLFGSNSNNYVEVEFSDFVDRNYVLALRMNELVSHTSEPDPSRTPDTSGNYGFGTLEGGAAFPLEYPGDGADTIVGKVGQAIYFPLAGGVRVASSPSLDQATQGLTVELFVRPLINLAQDEENRFIHLVNRPGAFSLILEENGSVHARVGVGGSERSLVFGSLPWGTFTHVAFTYDSGTGTLKGYVDGQLAGESAGAPGPIDTSSADLLVGPAGQVGTSFPFASADQAVLLLDELLVSDVARLPEELQASAYACDPADWASPDMDLPLGLRARDLRISSDSVSTQEAVSLGEMLFFDPRLSGAEDKSCATCHQPDAFFTDGLATALGQGEFLSRNTPTVLNRALSSFQFWDGRAGSLEEQSIIPIENPLEMNLAMEDLLIRLSAVPAYVEAFQEAFGEGPSEAAVELALAAYQRTLLSGNSAVDRYEAGDHGALSESERRGRTLFHTKARCIGCHSGSNYTDEQFRNNGATCVSDRGRGVVSGRSRDDGLFKTPSLRDVSRTAPYMHDGSIKTLDDVIEMYDQGGNFTDQLDTEIRPLVLTAQEKVDLVAFLRALDGEPLIRQVPELP